jgi:hypothetical protein
MKTNHKLNWPLAIALLAFFPITQASVVIEISTGETALNSTESVDVDIDYSGNASSTNSHYNISGSTAETGAFNATINVQLDAMKNTSADAATRGNKLTDANFNWDNTYEKGLGVNGDPNSGGVGYSETEGREGIQILLDLSDINSSLFVQLTSLNVQNVFQTEESFFVVNLETRDYLEFSSGSAGSFDISSLNITITGGESGAIAAIYSGDTGGFRLKGITLDAASTVVIHSQPTGAGVADADQWNITANGTLVPVYYAVAYDDGPMYFCSFDFEGTVSVCVESMTEICNPVLRPLSNEITIQTNSDHTISFDIDEPGQYCIEARNYTYGQPLCIFANPPEENVPDTNDTSVLYYEPGYHEVTTIPMGSNTNLYLAGGAYLKVFIGGNEEPTVESDSAGMPRWANMLYQSGKENITIQGRGIIDFSSVPWHGRQPFNFQSCTNVTIEGITVIDSPNWTICFGKCENILVDNVKLIGHRENSDGIDIVSSHDVTVSNCFIRTGDDGICAKSIACETYNISVENCVIWNDRVRGIGVCGESAYPIHDITFKNIDILHSLSSFESSYCMAVDINECGPVGDVLFEDIRIEDTTKLLRVKIQDAALSESSSYITNVVFKDIQYLEANTPSSEIEGAGPSHQVIGVTFENITFDGTDISSASAAGIDIGDYTSDISFE